MLTYARLKEVLSYDPVTGDFMWLVDKPSRIKAGDLAGTVRNGYRSIKIDQKMYLSHRLAWLYMTAAWPDQWIDHRDRDKLNNCFSNLRECTPSQNGANSRAKKAAFKGVFWHKLQRRWQASIKVNQKIYFLGWFDDPVAASAAYAEAAKHHFGEFARTA